MEKTAFVRAEPFLWCAEDPFVRELPTPGSICLLEEKTGIEQER